MDTDEIMSHLFGSEYVSSRQQSTKGSDESERSACLRSVHEWVEMFMLDIGDDSFDPPSTDDREGRLGPATVVLDSASQVGLLVMAPDRLSVNSQSNFSTICANVCLFKGKWQYEVQLGSKGVMQIGWTTNDSKFTQETGVGDTVNSYAYDGNRVRKWNVSTHKYGEPWLSGDVIGCTIDLDEGVMEFFRNGRSLGQAFKNIQLGPGFAYFPAVSLAFTEHLVANFGSTPLRYPVESFQPIQEPPYWSLERADVLFNWTRQLLLLFDLEDSGTSETSTSDETMSVDSLYLGLAGNIVPHLAPLLSKPYVIEDLLVPFLESLCDIVHVKPSAVARRYKLEIFLDMLWAFLEVQDMRKCLEHVVYCVLGWYRHVSCHLDYSTQKKSLLLLTYLVRHRRTRHFLLENVLFDKVSRFANFLHVKPLDELGLAQIVEHPWWETTSSDKDVEKNKESYLKACQKIGEAIANVESLQVNFLRKLLDNTDGTPTLPSSRKIFLKKFRSFLRENYISSQTLPLLQTPLPITLCCFHRLLVTFQVLWASEVSEEEEVSVPPRIFYDGTINYLNLDRLGGILSHLNKTFKDDLAKALGSDHWIVVAMTTAQSTSGAQASSMQESDSTIFSSAPPTLGAVVRVAEGAGPTFMVPALARMLSQQQTVSSPMLMERIISTFSRENDKHGPSSGNGNADARASLVELLDGLVLFYHTGAHRQLLKISSLRESMSEYSSALSDSKLKLESYRGQAGLDGEDEIVAELRRSCEVLETKLREQARHMAWVRSAVYSPDKQAHLAWILRIILGALTQASATGNLFSYVPEYYLDSLVGLCTVLRSYVHPTVPFHHIQGHEELLTDIAHFLCDHFADPRIVHANSKDTLVQALASFFSSPGTLVALEKVPRESQLKMVQTLLRPYENRAWAQSNWILVRIWQGCGFAFRYQKSPHLSRKIGPKIMQTDSGLISQTIKPCPSMLFQTYIKDTLVSNEPLATTFLNSLLNQLNWAFSEFIGMLQEIQNLSNRPQRVFIESRQLKICATCFDLALSLLRVLEMIVSVAKEVFVDPERASSDLLLSRLCQLLCQVLNRISSQAGCFQHVVILEIPDLETVDHFPILSAVVGILLALLEDEMAASQDEWVSTPKVAKSILSEPSFQMSSIHFVLGDVDQNSKFLDPQPFSFHNYADDVSEEELEKIHGMIALLEACQRRLSEVKDVSEDDLCTICYAFPISATFKPCNHQSCRACITHHLMNGKDCFFCKTPIQRVLTLDNKVLHDLVTRRSSTDNHV